MGIQWLIHCQHMPGEASILKWCLHEEIITVYIGQLKS